MTGPSEETEDPKIPKGAHFFEEIFRNREEGWFFGTEPSTLARRVHHFLRLLEIPMRGRLLDLGCGEGRDAVFFSSLGFDVEAVDGAPTAVARTRAALDRAGCVAEVGSVDIGRFPWRDHYDVVFANNAVQFAGAEALRVLDRIRSHTKPGGINAVGMFTREAVDWRREPDTYCLESRELRHYYRDWTLLEYGESVALSPRRMQYMSFANLIARRPEGG